MSRKHDGRGAISSIENDCEQLRAENEWLWRYVKHLLVKLNFEKCELALNPDGKSFNLAISDFLDDFD